MTLTPDAGGPQTAEAGPRGLDRRAERAWRGWLTMSELLRAQIARDVQAVSGLSDADFVILVHLAAAPGDRIRLSELATSLRWSKSRLSHQFARMEARGLVTRQDCPSDARGTFALLTPAGRREIDRVAPVHVASVRRHFADLLTPAQLDALGDLSDVVVGHLLDGQPASAGDSLPPCPG